MSMSHLSLLNELEKEVLLKKHPLANQDLEFRYAYCFGVTFLVCADNPVNDKEKGAMEDLLRSLELPSEYLEKILRAGGDPQKEMIQGLTETLHDKKGTNVYLSMI